MSAGNFCFPAKHFSPIDIIHLNHEFIRNNRKWTYDTIQCEGTEPVIKNPLLKEPETK